MMRRRPDATGPIPADPSRTERDRSLAHKMLAGQERAFDEFFEEYFPRLMRFAMTRMNRDASGAEEVVQSTLMAAITKMATYRGEASLFTWLCSFCRHEISAFYERCNRQPPSVDLAEESPEARAILESLTAPLDDDPERALGRQEVARLVHVTLDQLPGHYASVLEWKYIHGIPVAEIAVRLGVSPKAAESLLTRARQAFRDGFSGLMAHAT
ncbi:MAG: RNA polymerase sigma factor [Candidatus Polarisedimenticolia bacterium]